MTLVRWDPFRELSHLRHEMDRLFDYVRHPAKTVEGIGMEVLGPRVDVYQTEREVVVTAEIPGIETKDDVEITVSEDNLLLKGEVKRGGEVRQENFYRTERYYGSFSRAIALPAEIEADQATASYKNGILEVRMPKAAHQKRKTVKVDIH